MPNDEILGRQAMNGLSALSSASNANESLSDAKRALLERRLRGACKSSADVEIAPRPSGENPMSFGQERLWIQSQVTNNPSLFNIPFLAHIDGPLDLRALKASIDDVIARHEILRAGFLNVNGAPEQFFQTRAPIRIASVDLSAANQDALNELRARAREEAAMPFDLAAPPLMRITLFKLAPTRHALLFVVHHIVWDGWSSGVFIQEMTQLYEANRSGDDAALPAIHAQYSDFAHWHRGFMASLAGQTQLEYWRTRLAGLPELISLPTDRAREALQTHEGAVYEWRISANTQERIAALARRENVTQFAVFLAAYNVLLMRYSGQRDIAIGTTIAYRTRPALEKLVGFFANALVLRTALDDDPSFAALVARAQQTSVEAQSNQDVPFDMLVERLAPKRGLSHNPLFQVAFVLHNLPIDELRIGDLRINFEEINIGSATFDLVFHVFSERGGLKASFEYDAHLFTARTIEAMAARFDTLLVQLLDSPELPVSSARLIATHEEQELLAQSSNALAVDAGGLLQNLLDTSSPDAVAVVCGDARITYAELSARSDRLADHLREHGVVPDTPVAILMEPSVEMIVAMFGILKSDGAYLPLDPSFPRRRIQDILNDSGARLVITASGRADRLAGRGLQVIVLDQSEPTWSTCPSAPLPPRACVDNIAYYIYTSGSTGLSKGVMISHRSAVASTCARAQFYPEKVSSFLLLSSTSFDSSVAGIFWTLAQGGALHIATESERREPSVLARIISESRITHLLCLPSLHGALLDIARDVDYASLRCCIVAGELCRAELVEKHFRTLPRAEFINEYGPTECAVWSTAQRITSIRPGASVPIGRPIPGAQTLVLENDALVAQGVAGELCVGGSGLARGYLARADLTAERFRPSPFGVAGDRLYRTGDRARLNSDGELEFLGRLDEQIKIRGYRVDPREIESVMLQHPEVVDCIVLAKTVTNGHARLLAYCHTEGNAVDEAALKRHASSHLPSFMIPDLFILTDGLSRLPNGKIDRNALPAPREPQSTSTEHGASNESLIEALLADIWREALGVTEIKPTDNFFDLGGNSLTAIQVAARAQQMLGQEVSVVALFESADLAAFAKRLETALSPNFNGQLSQLLAQIESEAVI
jgi:amino acid adenylation domain-containing protein